MIVCAPSNSAADLLTERLVDSGLIKLVDMVRLNAFHRDVAVSIALTVQLFVNWLN